jgi:pimeloyl-ACP methyl ester carboxylesterase
MATPASAVEARQSRKRGWLRKIGRAFLALLVILGALAAIFWWRPTMVVSQISRTLLWVNGIHGQYASIDGHRIHYLAGGTGRPVVLIHGLGGRSEDWAVLLPQLVAGRFSAYAIDLLGYGRSDKPDVDYSIALEADIVRKFLEQKNLQQVDLVGWSMGGWVALKLAVDHPDRVHTLTLVDSAGFTFNAPDPKVLRPRTPHELEQMAALFSPKAGAIPGFLARDVLRVMGEQDWIVARALDSMYSGRDLMDGKVGRLRMPVLLLWGGKDVLTPLTAGSAMHLQMPTSSLQVIDGCGHTALTECRGRVVPAIVDFLQAHSNSNRS